MQPRSLHTAQIKLQDGCGIPKDVISAGALSKPILDNLIARGSIDATKIVQLDLSAPIPNYPVVMQGDLKPELKAAIRSAFLDMKDAEVAAFRSSRMPLSPKSFHSWQT